MFNFYIFIYFLYSSGMIILALFIVWKEFKEHSSEDWEEYDIDIILYPSQFNIVSLTSLKSIQTVGLWPFLAVKICLVTHNFNYFFDSIFNTFFIIFSVFLPS